MAERVTRGHGLLEGLLARRRAAMAYALLRDSHGEAILDVGCGAHPLFLLGADFPRRTGIDKRVRPEHAPDGITLVRHDFEADPTLPFDTHAFDVVTMLAVFEHVQPAALQPLLADIRRVLRPGGTLVLTTPAAWTHPLLRGLAALHIVSHEEIDEHKDTYDQPSIRRHLEDAGFHPDGIRSGSFELSMNLWATATA